MLNFFALIVIDFIKKCNFNRTIHHSPEPELMEVSTNATNSSLHTIFIVPWCCSAAQPAALIQFLPNISRFSLDNQSYNMQYALIHFHILNANKHQKASTIYEHKSFHILTFRRSDPHWLINFSIRGISFRFVLRFFFLLSFPFWFYPS